MNPHVAGLIIGLNCALVAIVAVLLVMCLPKPWQVPERKWLGWAVFSLVCFTLEGGLIGWVVNLGVVHDSMG